MRAHFVTTWMGAVPGYVLVAFALIAIGLAAKALLLPARIVPVRKGEAPWWVDLRDDWNHWWHRQLGRRFRGANSLRRRP